MLPRSREALTRLGVGIAALAALFLVGRGIAEFFTVDYGDPSSYRDSWDGPSLAGVFAVHSGPGLAVVVTLCLLAWRRLHRRHDRRAGQPGRNLPG